MKSYIYGTHNNYSNILGVKPEIYIKREIYSVREGIQYDGLDYYVYGFSKENWHDLVKKVDIKLWRKNNKWNMIIEKKQIN